ncbi:heme ABC transporter ATP-binding protein [Thiomicrorhabdus indica]|uniref:heme ABC transporter ATP-binding protein n=1 Tax=Thiomicrorhabdus indica TaxID=2267253 RepID=UPI00102D7116|nr:ATP-binding cassette domain-containing protein [Thiomicrorhabdus indica]
MSIRCENLSYVVSDKNAQRMLLAQIDSEFQGGKIHVILGQNGAGKSTLLKVLSREIEGFQGNVLWNGKPLEQKSLQSLAIERAVVEQKSSLAFDFTVCQFVSLGLEVQFSSELLDTYHRPVDFEQRLRQILRTCDLLSFAERSVLSLSGGEFQRVQIARAIAQIWPLEFDEQSTPDFSGRWLFLDEWNSGLDIAHQQCFASLLRTWAEAGLGVIMVVHELPLAMQLADEVMLLKNGEVFAQGRPDDVFTDSVLGEGLQMQLQQLTTETGQKVFLPKYI